MKVTYEEKTRKRLVADFGQEIMVKHIFCTCGIISPERIVVEGPGEFDEGKYQKITDDNGMVFWVDNGIVGKTDEIFLEYNEYDTIKVRGVDLYNATCSLKPEGSDDDASNN